MILAEDPTNPTFYASFRGFLALFLGFGLKAFVFSFVAVPAKWIRTSRRYVLNIYTYNNAYTDVFQTDFGEHLQLVGMTQRIVSSHIVG